MAATWLVNKALTCVPVRLTICAERRNLFGGHGDQIARFNGLHLRAGHRPNFFTGEGTDLLRTERCDVNGFNGRKLLCGEPSHLVVGQALELRLCEGGDLRGAQTGELLRTHGSQDFWLERLDLRRGQCT
jgi:hypothetical protein